MKNDDGALSFGTSVDLRGLETGISQIEAKIATMEGKLGAKIDGIGKAVSRSGITAKSTLEDVTNAGNVLDGTLGNVAKTAASIGMAFTAQSLIRQIINIRGEFQQLAWRSNPRLLQGKFQISKMPSRRCSIQLATNPRALSMIRWM